MRLSTSDGYFSAVLGRDTWNRDVGTDIYLLYFCRSVALVFCILYNGIFAWEFVNYLFGLGVAMPGFGMDLLFRER